MGVAIARVGDLLTTLGRQAVPLDGIFSRDWQPVTALAIYWFESLLLALIAVALCALIERRTPPAEMKQAGLMPQDVAVFHIGSLLVFGGFFSGLMFILIGNHHIEQRFIWSEVRDGALAMMAEAGIGFLIDLWRVPSMPLAAVQSRVDACTGRWALFWLVGFFGVGMMVFTGNAGIVLGLFGVLKLIWEVWGSLARIFGWRSLKDREAEAAARG
jgi:hypothetical protein